MDNFLSKSFAVRHTKKSRQMASKLHGKFNSRKANYERSLLLALPQELLVLVLTYLPPKDLIRARQICSKFQQIVYETKCLWMKIRLPSLQPSPSIEFTKFFEKLAYYGNPEASIKLAIHHLYFFNLKDVIKTESTAIRCAKQSCEFFMNAEKSLPLTCVPFTWLFTRPPWVLKSGGLSNKELIFRLMMELIAKCLLKNTNDKEIQLKISSILSSKWMKFEFSKKELDVFSPVLNSKLAYNVGKLLMLCERDELRLFGRKVLELSSHLGNLNAKYETLRITEDSYVGDFGSQLQWHRSLRNCALAGHSFAKLHLCVEYAKGRVDDVGTAASRAFIKEVMEESKPSNIHTLKKYQKELEDVMRVILIDWLIEITDTKDMPPQTVFIAVDILDRFLLARPVKRIDLQLAGTTALLLSTRFCCEKDQLLTIRESSWLTDNTYGYREVVYMMGEYTGALRGQLIQPTLYDYAKIVSTLAKFVGQDEIMMRFILESCLKFADFGRYNPSMIASAAVLLVNIVQEYDAWPSYMEECTGYEVTDLANCAMLLSLKCLNKLPVFDDREQPVQAADLKYSSERYMQVSKHSFPSCEEIKNRILSLDERLVPVQRDDLCHFEVSFLDVSHIKDTSRSSEYEADCEDTGDMDSSFDELALFRPARCVQEDGDCSDLDLNEEVQDIMDANDVQAITNRDGVTPSFYSDTESKLRLLPHRMHHAASVAMPMPPVESRANATKGNWKKRNRLTKRKYKRNAERIRSSSGDFSFMGTVQSPADKCLAARLDGSCGRPLSGRKRPAPSRIEMITRSAKRKKAVFDL